VTKEFEFVDQGLTFFCSVEAPLHAGMPPWWWFRVDTGKSTRHAPFAASPKDTKQSVQARIIAYYAELLAIQARPVHQRPVWRKPVRPPEPATAEVTSSEPAVAVPVV
jgi:hypothetical protein